MNCWNCKSQVNNNEMFCSSCGYIQPPAPVDHFARLETNKNFEIGEKNLDASYFKMQMQLHPDKFTKKSQKEQQLSAQQSVAVNEAYETLKNPLKRAEYLLFLRGIIVNNDGNDTVKPSQEVLIESIETREYLDNIKSQEELSELLKRSAEGMIGCIEKIKSGFEDNNIDDVAQSTIRLRYLEKLIEEIKKKQL